MENKVSIATKPLVYSAFRYISNKVWNALAEYIDNSIQSFLDHKDILEKINPKGKLEVDICITDETITVRDNAFGITEDNYQRAFELANIPLDAKGLNEFGMGMKVSSIWMSDLWSVTTSAYGEDIKKTMVFDIKEVTENQETVLPVDIEPAAKDEHYTVITLKKLSLNRPTSGQFAAIKRHIASIYTKYLREDMIDIIINGELLHFKELKVLSAPYWKTPNGEPVLWRKEISESFLKPGGGSYEVKGFIGILETMSTDVDNGFLLFRRGRVIGSSYNDRYRPIELSGQPGSPRHKRIFGELYIEGFNVSFTKNSFQEDDNFKIFIGLLHDKIAKDKTFDIFGQAQNYTKPKTIKEKKTVAEELLKNIATTIKTVDETTFSEENLKNEPLDQHKNVVSEDYSQNNMKSSPTKKPEAIQEEFAISPISSIVKLSANKKFCLTVQGVSNDSSRDFYSLREVSPKENYEATINLKHPLFEKYADLLESKDGMAFVSEFLKSMVTSEISLIDDGSGAGGEFRLHFNKFFGKI